MLATRFTSVSNVFAVTSRTGPAVVCGLEKKKVLVLLMYYWHKYDGTIEGHGCTLQCVLFMDTGRCKLL